MIINITEEQLGIFRNLELNSFVEELLPYFDYQYPYFLVLHGKEKFKQLIRASFGEAIANGFTLRGTIRYYIDLMLLFGSGFATDPQYQWILEEYKKDEEKAPEIVRADRLCAIVNHYFETIYGKNNSQIPIITDEIKHLDVSLFYSVTTDYTDLIADILQHIHKARMTFITKENLLFFVRETINRASSEYGLNEKASVGIFCLLSYFYGYRFDRDPFLAFNFESLALNRSEMNMFGFESLIKLLDQWINLRVYYNQNNNKEII